MQRSVVLLLVATALAGCSTGGSADAPGAFDVRILYDERSTFYAGDAVDLEGFAFGETVVRWQWDFGDGSGAEGRRVQHVFDAGGEMHVRLKATRDDGATAVGEAMIAIQDLFGGLSPATNGSSSAPPPTGDTSGIVNLSLAGDEPVTGEPFELRLDGPSILGGGRVTVWLADQVMEFDVEGFPAAIPMDALDAGRHRAAWMAQLEDDTYSGSLSFDVWGQEIGFGAPGTADWLRPGTHSSVCTTNFLFHYKWYRFFIGSAAHCVDDLDINEVCQAKPTGKIGKKETLTAHDSSKATSDVWVAYESWLTMDRIGERNGNVCSGNDFALLELGPEAQELMHPAALFYGGPTALAPAAGYSMGTTLYGYGASNLHGNVGVGYPGQEAVNRKVGLSLGSDNGGYSQHLLFALPGVPGDSGGPAFGPGGEALGAASTITLAPTPGTNRYTNVAKALEYMQEHEGWAPELVTHDSWSITGT